MSLAKQPPPTPDRRAGSAQRVLLYALLLVFSALFLFPLAWMILTSLKPIHQTMAHPPVWLPSAEHAVLDGAEREIVRERITGEPSVILTLADGPRAGQTRLVECAALPPDASLQPGDSVALPAALDGATRAHVVKLVPTGWWRVSEFIATKTVHAEPRWDVVPPEAIRTTPRLRLENYPKALAALGGESIETIEGGPAAPDADADFRSPDRAVPFARYVFNTLVVCLLGTLGAVFSNALTAYAFARLKWRGRDTLFALTLAVMMVPFPVLMVPLYDLFRAFGWIGTWYPLWLPACFGNAFLIFLMRQFFLTLPESLSEAARIDGCGEWGIFWRVILPLSKPVLAVAGLFHFMGAWNDFMGPLLFLTRRSTFTLALALQQFQSQHGGVQWHYLMAASTVMALPIIVLFFCAQKTFIRGIATTGIK